MRKYLKIKVVEGSSPCYYCREMIWDCKNAIQNGSYRTHCESYKSLNLCDIDYLISVAKNKKYYDYLEKEVIRLKEGGKK